MADLSPIMTLFREWETKYAEAGDEAKTSDSQSDALLDQCRAIEQQMIPLLATSAGDFAAKFIVRTAYGDFCPADDLIAEAKALVAGQAVAHPDANLIELGRQFEATKADARKRDADCTAPFEAYETARRAAGIPDLPCDQSPEQKVLEKKIYRDTGCKAASDTFNKAHSECIRLMKEIHRAKATTLEGFAVKAAAVAFDQADFEVDVPVPSDVAERELYRLARDMAKVVKAGAGKAAHS